MKKLIFKGAGTAIVTPFTQTGIDFDKLKELIEFQISGGIDMIVICGTTGEASTMDDEEHKSAIKFAVEAVRGRVPVIAGTGSNDTRHAIELIKYAEEVGADASLNVTPYYNKTTQKGLVAHFGAIAKSVKIPLVLYNVPGRTGMNINPETYKELSKIENIVGVKECNLSQMEDTINLCGDDLIMYTGEDGQAIQFLAAGAQGLISVMSNIIPRDTHDLVMKFLEGDVAGSRKMHLKLHDLVKALFCEVNPIPVKAAMNMMGMNVGIPRMPLVEISDKGAATLREAMKNYGLIK